MKPALLALAPALAPALALALALALAVPAAAQQSNSGGYSGGGLILGPGGLTGPVVAPSDVFRNGLYEFDGAYDDLTTRIDRRNSARFQAAKMARRAKLRAEREARRAR